MNISTRLRELLSLHGVTQVELAHALNVATSYINAVVNGKKKLPLDSLECICSYLGISMAEFFQPFSDQPPLPKHIETFRAATADLQEDEVPPLLAMVVWMRNHRISQRSSLKQRTIKRLLVRLPQDFQYIVLRTGMTIGLLSRKSMPILIASFRSAPAAIAWSPGFIAEMW